MNKTLNQIAKEVVAKTILAADESTGTISKRLTSIGVDSTPEVNREYRQMLFTASGIENYVSGVILFDETIRQSSNNEIPFLNLLDEINISPGIKVDKGTAKFSEDKVDRYTEGADGLEKRFLYSSNLFSKPSAPSVSVSTLSSE